MESTQVAVLGPVTAQVAGRPVDVGGARQRALLGALAAARGKPVGLPRLEEELWGPDERSASAKTLSVYVSRLRKVLGDVVRLEPGGYCLDARVRVDADEAHDALLAARAQAAAGHHGEAVATLAGALAGWHGEPYAGLEGPIAVGERARLQELHLSLHEERAAALLALGEHSEVVLSLVTQDRTVDSDRLSALLAIALHRSGRPLEALEAVRARRDRLLDSGLDPSNELTALEQDLLERAAHLEPGVPGQRRPEPAAAPRAGGARPPAPLSSFVGRDGELQAARAALREARLVTLLGTGGVGKTRAALELVRGLPAAAVAWLPLAEHDHAGLLPAAVATALGVTPPGGTPPERAVADALGEQEVLLVVDNCEHLVDAVAALVARLLADCPGLRVLATSRERLGLAGEVAVEVGPLPVRTADGDDGPAVALFLSRAAAAGAAWSPDEDDLRWVRGICTALDGLPLALELAAARCPAMAPADIAAELQDRFSLLTRRGDLLPHHRSLHAAIDWSYRLLPEDEQHSLRALAVFDGGFELDAATAVLGRPAARVVAELVSRSLLAVDLSVRPRRHRMLESIREFAWRQADGAERADVRRRHVAWVAQAVRTAASGIVGGPDGPACMARLAAERGNVRAAVAGALECGDTTAALQITGDLGFFWYRRGLVDEGLALLGAALSASGPDDSARARALLSRAHLLQLSGDVAGALDAAQAALSLRERIGDQALVGRIEGALSWALTGAGRLDEARLHGERAVELGRVTGSGSLASEAALSLALHAVAAGSPDAERLALEAADLARAAGHDWTAGTATWIAASWALGTGAHRLAAARASRVVEHGRQGSDDVLVLRGALVLAGALAGLGEGVTGARLLGAVRSLAARTRLQVEHRAGELDAVLALLRAALGSERLDRECAAANSWGPADVSAAVLAVAARLHLSEDACACAGSGGGGVLLLMPTVRRQPA